MRVIVLAHFSNSGMIKNTVRSPRMDGEKHELNTRVKAGNNWTIFTEKTV